MKILFICKYNRFRSKFAEAYFNKMNTNKKNKASSAGIIKVDKPLTVNESKRNRYIKKKFGLEIDSKSRGISASLLENNDKVIIVANDLPKIVFNHPNWENKIEMWKIPDERKANKANIDKSVKLIKNKINKLLK